MKSFQGLTGSNRKVGGVKSVVTDCSSDKEIAIYAYMCCIRECKFQVSTLFRFNGVFLETTLRKLFDISSECMQ